MSALFLSALFLSAVDELGVDRRRRKGLGGWRRGLWRLPTFATTDGSGRKPEDSIGPA